MIRHGILVTTVLLWLVVPTAWAAGRQLTDQELDQVTAGSFNMQAVLDGGLKFAFDTPAGVKGDGTLDMKAEPLLFAPDSFTVNNSSLSLSGNAQQNLSSMVNVIAINSKVNVLLNLNINLPNSILGSLNLVQGNAALQ